MWNFLRPLFRYLFIALDVAFVVDLVDSHEPKRVPDSGEPIEYSDTSMEGIYIEEVFPDWELIYNQMNIADTFSSFRIAENDLSEIDLLNTFLGEVDDEIASITISGIDLSQDTIWFNYEMIYDDYNLLKEGIGFVLSSENRIEFDQLDLYSGIIYKIENIKSNRTYVIMAAPKLNSDGWVFINHFQN